MRARASPWLSFAGLQGRYHLTRQNRQTLIHPRLSLGFRSEADDEAIQRGRERRDSRRLVPQGGYQVVGLRVHD